LEKYIDSADQSSKLRQLMLLLQTRRW
jgi:hypothetical protein